VGLRSPALLGQITAVGLNCSALPAREIRPAAEEGRAMTHIWWFWVWTDERDVQRECKARMDVLDRLPRIVPDRDPRKQSTTPTPEPLGA